jgi:ABC-type dipeptide/oligopeptide/nickel transport system ATPase subunit
MATAERTPQGTPSVHGAVPTGEPLLRVQDLRTYFATAAGVVRAVDGVSFDLYPGETFGIVGESGSGKSVTCRSVIGLLPSPPAYTTGTVLYQGRNLVGLSMQQMQAVRGAHIAMIFQDPMTSLNPVMRVGDQIAEALEAHTKLGRAARRLAALDLMRRVGIPLAERRMKDYPHQFSGGMRQRVLIAIALACTPRILLADEPTTALDVTIQDQILSLLLQLQSDFGRHTDAAEEAAPPLHRRPAALAAGARRLLALPDAHPRRAARADRSAAGLPLLRALRAAHGRVPQLVHRAAAHWAGADGPLPAPRPRGGPL